MPHLILLRHFKSQWNLENRFTGWADVPLCKDVDGKINEAINQLIGVKLDVIYTSPLIRNMASVLKLFKTRGDYPIFIHFGGKMEKWGGFNKNLNDSHLPVYVTEALNERYYGELQGLNKTEIIDKYGPELVHQWRRSFKKAPPGGESLVDVVKRTAPFYKKYIEKDLMASKNIMVVASHNSLRALIKYIEKISDKDIINLEVPYGGLIKYEFTAGNYKKLTR